VRILIVKLGAIGDIVHALPALAVIRKAFPSASISWVVESRSAEILRDNPLVDEVIEVDTRKIRKETSVAGIIPEIKSQLESLRRLRFDVAIDLQGLLKSGAIAKLSGAEERWGFSKKDLREPASRVFLTKTVKIPAGSHIIRKNLILVETALAIAQGPERIEFPIATTENHSAEAQAVSNEAAGGFAILNPGGGWVTKLWPAEKYGRLADQLWEKTGIVPVVTVGPGEDILAEQILKSSRSGRVIDARLSLKGFYELSKLAAVYVGGDTGPTHLAIAAGTPVVGLFGPTEWWRNGSLDPRDICVERLDIGCRTNCHRRTCSNWICMDIDVERVFDAVRGRLTGV
jgi:lipopolysaccharide heptosyltransferase I